MNYTNVNYQAFARSNGKKEKNINYLIEHLEKYGNTILNENPQKYEDQLKEYGIEITYKKLFISEGIRNIYIIERT